MRVYYVGGSPLLVHYLFLVFLFSFSSHLFANERSLKFTSEQSTKVLEQPLSQSPANSCDIGTLDSKFSVDPFGQATYSVPISVPPGIGSMAPSVSLTYNSSAPNGHFGVGWHLKAGSTITRCPPTHVRDGYIGGVKFTNEDRFCLDGAPLVLTSGNYGENGSTYRTSPDNMTLVVLYTSGGIEDEPLFFRAYAKNGLIMEYGGNENTIPGFEGEDGRIRVVPSAQNSGIGFPVRVWALSRTIDRVGKFIDYRYSFDNTIGEFFLSEINYTGTCTLNASPGNLPEGCQGQPLTDPFNQIKFVSTFRPDQEAWHSAGARIDLVVRIAEIQTYINVDTNPELVGRYKLDYEVSTISERSRLKTITRCDGEPLGQETCFKPLKFSWTDQLGGSLRGRNVGQVGSGFGGRTRFRYRRFQAEWNQHFGPRLGEAANIAIAFALGAPHLVIQQATVYALEQIDRATTYFKTNTGKHFSIQGGLFLSRFLLVFNRVDMLQAQLGDFNGDGKTDVAQLTPGLEANVSLSDGSSLIPNGQWANDVGPVDQMRVVDLNGDNLSDLLYLCYERNGACNAAFAHISTGSSFQPQTFWANDIGNPSKIGFGDVNGDGLPDMIQVPGTDGENNGGQLRVWTSDGTRFVDRGLRGPNFGQRVQDISVVKFADFDGDKADDIIELRTLPSNPADRVIRILKSTDTGSNSLTPNFVTVQEIPTPNNQSSVLNVGDFNGDGLADIVLFEPDGANNSNAKFWVSTGNEFIRAQHYDFTAADALVYRRNGDIVDVSARLADFNGDGRTDIMMLFDSFGVGTKVFYARANTFKLTTFWGPFQTNYQREDIAFGDLDGDGRTDLIEFPDVPNLQPANVYLSDINPTIDRIRAFETGYGNITAVQYSPISDDSIYTPAASFGGNEPGTKEMRGPFYVVSSVSTLKGFDNFNLHRISYQGAKFHEDRGFLGFESVARFDEDKHHLVETDYYQTFPTIAKQSGNRFYVETSPGNFTLVSESELKLSSVPEAPLTPARLNIVEAVSRTYELNGILKNKIQNSWGYDSYDNLVSTKQVFGGGRRTSLSREIINDPNIWMIGYIDTETSISEDSSGTNAKRVDFSFSYDLPKGLITDFSTSWTADGTNMSLSNTYTYDSVGNVLTSNTLGTDLAARINTRQYDIRNQFLISETDPLGHVTEKTYDPRFGSLKTLKDPNQMLVSYQFDGFGRPIASSFPHGVNVDVNYCFTPDAAEIPNDPLYSHAMLIRKTGTPDQRVYFDLFGRIIREASDGFDGTPLITDIEHDQLYRVSSISDPYYLGSQTVPKTTFEYDPLDRVNKVYKTSGGIYTFNYSAPATPSSNPLVTGNGMGSKVEISYPGTRKSVRHLDDSGFVVQIEDIDTATSQTLAKLSYFYDGNGDLEQTADFDGNINKFEFDDIGNMIRTLDANIGQTSSRYNALGNIIESIDALGQTRTYKYDVAGRLIESTDPDYNTLYVYDSQFNNTLSSVFRDDGYEEHLFYDNLSRLSAIETNFIAPTGRPASYSQMFKYNSIGKMDEVTYPTSSNPIKVNYRYTPKGYLNSVQRTLDDGTRETILRIEAMTARGKPQRVTLGNNLSTTYKYDEQTGLLRNIVTKRNGTLFNRFVQRWEYSYDNLYRLISREDKLRERLYYYDYDILDRVTSLGYCLELFCAAPFTYDYNEIGNIEQVTELLGPGSKTYQYNSSKPHAVTDLLTPSGTEQYSYDAKGQMDSGSGNQYQWTAEGLPRIINTSTTQYDFLHSPGTRKLAQLETGFSTVETDYVGDMYQATHDFDNSTVTERNFLYAGPAPFAMIERENGGGQKITYLHPDRLDSIDATTDANRTLLSRQIYNAWGDDTLDGFVSPSGPGNKGFTGHEHLSDAGLIDMRSRLYDPNLGRFLSGDPGIPGIENSQSFNRYSYVNNNPTNYIDPSGLQYTETNPGSGPDWTASWLYNNGDTSDLKPNYSFNPDDGVAIFIGRTKPSLLKGGGPVFSGVVIFIAKKMIEERRSRLLAADPVAQYTWSRGTPSGRNELYSFSLAVNTDPVINTYDQLTEIRDRLLRQKKFNEVREDFSTVLSVAEIMTAILASEFVAAARVLRVIEGVDAANNIVGLTQGDPLTPGAIISLLGAPGTFRDLGSLSKSGLANKQDIVFGAVKSGYVGMVDRALSNSTGASDVGVWFYTPEGEKVYYGAAPPPNPAKSGPPAIGGFNQERDMGPIITYPLKFTPR